LFIISGCNRSEDDKIEVSPYSPLYTVPQKPKVVSTEKKVQAIQEMQTEQQALEKIGNKMNTSMETSKPGLIDDVTNKG
jgi:hypothetical protein